MSEAMLGKGSGEWNAGDILGPPADGSSTMEKLS